ncbi:MAG: hypothetical protein JWQ87_2956 [Candidatus Sulfotelmatobacter sp.]|nr:hypothetical protein [Candidatus Sulfotelmatobacter sp.]
MRNVCLGYAVTNPRESNIGPLPGSAGSEPRLSRHESGAKLHIAYSWPLQLGENKLRA